MSGNDGMGGMVKKTEGGAVCTALMYRFIAYPSGIHQVRGQDSGIKGGQRPSL